MRAVSQEIPQPLTTKISLKITHLKFTLNPPGANELNCQSLVMPDAVMELVNYSLCDGLPKLDDIMCPSWNL